MDSAMKALSEEEDLHIPAMFNKYKEPRTYYVNSEGKEIEVSQEGDDGDNKKEAKEDKGKDKKGKGGKKGKKDAKGGKKSKENSRRDDSKDVSKSKSKTGVDVTEGPTSESG